AIDAEVVPRGDEHLTLRVDRDARRVVDRIVAELALAEYRRDHARQAVRLADAVVVPVIDVDRAGRVDRHVLRPVELGLRQHLPVPVVARIRLTGDGPDDGRGGFPRRLDLRSGAELPQ